MKNLRLLPLLLLAGSLAPSLSAQNLCDTLLTKTGQQQLIQITGSANGGIWYVKCGEESDYPYFLEKEKIEAIRFSPRQLPVKHKKKVYDDLSRPPAILWLGTGVLNLVGISDGGSGLPIKFGAEFGIKNRPLRVAMLFQAISLRNETWFVRNGLLNGELAAVAKQFTFGRLSGTTSKSYWGLDLRLGWASFHVNTDPFFSKQTELRSLNWLKAMPCVGYQVSWRSLMLNLHLPIGFQTTTYRNPKTKQRWADLTLNPSLFIGLWL